VAAREAVWDACMRENIQALGAVLVAVSAAAMACPSPRPSPPPPSSLPSPAPSTEPTASNEATTGPAPATSGAACGRLPGQPIQPMNWPFGHDATCDRAATTWGNVPHADRVCDKDSDCKLVTADGNCILNALNVAAAARPEYANLPCGNPASGACAMDRGAKARCKNGCCSAY
jgi:hypothetical protein